jgi:hypothetical protein
VKNKIKKEFYKEKNIDKLILKNDLKMMENLLKKINFVKFPCRFQLFKNKNTNRMYLTTTSIDFKLIILNFSDGLTFNEQIKELFPEYNFFEKECAVGFNMFPGMKNSIYGYSDENDIILGSSTVVLEF